MATDLNQAMLDHAAEIGTARPVQWRQADAMQLPFGDACFDAVVCQFGVMFFPDKAKAFSEARRVLAPGGVLLFNVWDRIEDNEFADVVTAALAELFPQAPPRFLARTPHGYYDLAPYGATWRRAASTRRRRSRRWPRSRAASPRVPALAYCQGTPLRNEIEARDARGSPRRRSMRRGHRPAIRHGAVDGKIQAHIVSIEH